MLTSRASRRVRIAISCGGNRSASRLLCNGRSCRLGFLATLAILLLLGFISIFLLNLFLLTFRNALGLNFKIAPRLFLKR